MTIGVYLYRTIYWAEAGVIKSSTDDGTDIRILADDLGNITAIDISQGNVSQTKRYGNIPTGTPLTEGSNASGI